MTKTLAQAIRAKPPILHLTATDEAAALEAIDAACTTLNLTPVVYAAGQPLYTLRPSDHGATTLPDKPLSLMHWCTLLNASTDTQPPPRIAWIALDLTGALEEPTNPIDIRALTIAARAIEAKAPSAIVMLSRRAVPPPSIAHLCATHTLDLPRHADMTALVRLYSPNTPETEADNLAHALLGIDADAAKRGLKAALVAATETSPPRPITPTDLDAHKRQAIEASGLLRWLEPRPMSAVGGLTSLREYIAHDIAATYSAQGRAAGLAPIRGILLAGRPGTGKSLIARAVAHVLSVPLVGMDIGGLKSSLVGASETNIRAALSTIRAIGDCVVFVDEIEKSLANATKQLDGGVSGDFLSQLLQFQQEDTARSLLVATTNDAEALPPELRRPPRISATWYCDLPGPSDRIEILEATRNTRGGNFARIDGWQDSPDEWRAATVGFSGAEIAECYDRAALLCFHATAKHRPERYLIEAANSITPQAISQAETVMTQRQWARQSCRLAAEAQPEALRKPAAPPPTVSPIIIQTAQGGN